MQHFIHFNSILNLSFKSKSSVIQLERKKLHYLRYKVLPYRKIKILTEILTEKNKPISKLICYTN